MNRRNAAAILSVVLMAGCASGADDGAERGAARRVEQPDGSETTQGTAAPSEPLEWRDCGDIQCATLSVPAVPGDPAGGDLDLALGRRPASGDRVGTLLVNPGGPGAAGIPVVRDASAVVSDELLDRFDIVSWDPRGVGSSTPIDCVDNLDFFFATDKSPDDAGEIEENVSASRRLANACRERSGELLPKLSSSAIVDDMEAIRVALGEEKLNYLGFSYGTYLGALYAERYPANVRALVLDGALDPSLGAEELTRDQAVGFDGALNAFLDDCARRDCEFGGNDPHRAYRALMAQIDAESLPGEVGDEERTLGPGETDIGVATALYGGEQAWGVLAEALSEAARGDGSTLLRLADAYTGRQPGGTYENRTEAFYGIGCRDAPAPPIEELPAVAARIGQVAPQFGPATAWLSAPCSVWPVPAAGAPAAIRAPAAPPIVVLGTSNDPATPLKWARALADQLESARLAVYEGEGHLAYGRGSECIDDAVDRYLVDLELPPDGLVC